MANQLISGIAKANGFTPEEQLILQIGLSPMLNAMGGTGGGGGMGRTRGGQSNPFISMAMALAGLMLLEQQLKKQAVSQNLNPSKGPATVGGAVINLAQLLLGNSSASTGTQAPTQVAKPPLKLTPALTAAQVSLNNPSMTSMTNAATVLDAFTAPPKKKPQPIDMSGIGMP
jgi:hypothetical protein